MTESLITQHIDLWTSAIEAKSTAGRGSKNKFDLYGIKKLRELILELAVRGKLVPQDSAEGQALENITAENVQRKIKTLSGLAEITDEEKQFELPGGWVWTRLGSIIQISSGDGLTSGKMNSDGNIPVFGGNGITGYHDAYNVFNETLVIGRVGFYCGSVHITPLKAWVTDNAFITKFSEKNLSIRYLYWLLKASNLNENDSATAQPVISGRKVYPIVVAIPPLAEQHRIVAKVDELMALCDQLEQQTLTSIDAHVTLVETLLETLTNSADAAELEQNWARISEHFDTLFTTEQSIDALKQTILQLAVMGKLVRQDPTDEPASVLLEKIAAEKAQLIKDKKIKKEKPLPPISDYEKPFELPQGWEWCRLGVVAILKGGFAYKSDAFLVQGGHQVIRMGNIRPNNLRIDENPVFIPDELAENTADYEISVGDILLTMTGTKGKRDYLYSVLVPDNKLTNKKFYLNQRLCKLSTLLVDNFFIDYAIKNDLLLDAIYAKSTGTANQANIGMEAISHWLIPLPPLKEQNRIANAIKELNTLCDDLKVRTSKLKKMELYITDALIEHNTQ